MTPPFHFDVGSQYATAGILCLVFGAALLVVGRRFPNIIGVRRLALGFLCAAAGLVIFLARGPIPFAFSVVGSNILLWLAFLLFYAGFAPLLNLRARLAAPSWIAAGGVLLLAFFCRGFVSLSAPPHIVERIVTLCFVDAVIPLWLLFDLLRHARSIRVARWLAALVAASCVVNAARGVATLYFGAYGNIFHYDPVQALYGIASLLGVCGVAIFSVALIGRQISSLLEQTARIDSLTGALNRRGIEEILALELERSRRMSVAFSLALLDIDHFKTFNDLGGHQVGDEVLRQVVGCIRDHLRPFDACGRMGGDEFMLLLPGATHHEAAHICQRILHAVAGLAPAAPGVPSATLSIGFTQAEVPEPAASVVARADRALYAAKRNGRNCASMELAAEGSSEAAASVSAQERTWRAALTFRKTRS